MTSDDTLNLSLGELCTFVRGVTYEVHEASPMPSDSCLPILRAGNIADSLDLEHDLVWVPSTRVSNEQRLRGGDIVMCMSSGSAKVVGKSALVMTDWAGSAGAFCGILRPRSNVQARWLAYWLRSVRFVQWRDSQARGANIQNLRFSQLSAVKLQVPSLKEQQRIVAKLDEQMAALDRAKKALAEQREAATTLRSTVIRATLDPATHITWPTYPLGDLLEKICNGVSALQNQDKIGLPVTRIETISTGSIDTDRVGYLNLPADHLRDHLLEPGDILFSHINSFERIGNCAVYSGTPNRLVHGMNLLRFKPKRSLVAPEYLLCYLRAPTARAFFSATARRAIGQASINIRDLSVMPIALPPLQIQKSIAEYLDNSSRQTDALVAALGVRVRTLDSLRTSLLNAAFSEEV